jgi:hypothetical protein
MHNKIAELKLEEVRIVAGGAAHSAHATATATIYKVPVTQTVLAKPVSPMLHP